MKKPTISQVRTGIVLSATLFLFSFFQMPTGFSQEWQPIVDLVFAGHNCDDPEIAAFENNIHVVWVDERDNSMYPQIYYKRSMDDGLTWEPGKRLSKVDDAICQGPAIAVFEQDVHLVWTEERGPALAQVFYCRSYDGGETFSDPVQCFTTPPGLWDLDIAAFGTYIHVVWVDTYMTSISAIRYMNSWDNGATWSLYPQLSTDGIEAFDPQIEVSGPNVFLCWDELPTSGFGEITFRRSMDHGSNWELQQTLTITHDVDDAKLALAVWESALYLVWENRLDALQQIYFMHSHNDGLNWSTEMRITDNLDKYFVPQISVFDNKVHVTADNLNGEVVYLRSDNFGENWDPLIPLSSSSYQAGYGSIASWEENIFVVFLGFGPNANILFRRYISNFSVEENPGPDPNTAYLFQNSPNPFSGSTNISFYLPDPGHVVIKVYNSVGKEIAVMAEDNFPAGKHTLTVKAAGLSPGIYYYQLQVLQGNNLLSTDSRKMILNY